MKRLIITADHRAVDLAKTLYKKAKSKYKNLETILISPEEKKPIADYPIYAEKGVKEFYRDYQNSIGIFICGSGRGMCSIIKEYRDIKTSLCPTPQEAENLAKEKYQIICIGVNTHTPNTAWEIAQNFIQMHTK